MTEGNMNVVIPETDITVLKEALCAQQRLLQKLYAELDVEREASATAVSEALSMILRLQEEKSAVLMEANQYKRMTEEKISHAEESMENFEELMYQKQMEIASLEFQVQAYKCKLLSVGCGEVGETCENKFVNNFLLPANNNNNNAMAGETGANGHVTRLKSLPPLQLKDSSQSRRKRSMTPEPDMVIKIMEQTTANHEMNDQKLEKKNEDRFEGGDLDSYWEQIRKLDERVKEIMDRPTSLKVESKTSSLISQSISSIYDAGQTIKTKGDRVEDLKMSKEKEAFRDSACSSSVYDVFEVPQVNESSKNCLKKVKEHKNTWHWGEENRLGKPDLGMKEILEPYVNGDSELVKKLLLANHDKGLCRPREGSNIDCNNAIVQPEFNITEFQPQIQEPNQRIERVEPERTCTSHDIAAQREEELHLLGNSAAECGLEFQQLRQRIEQLEVNRNGTRHEILGKGQEELVLLREIREQLNSIHVEIRSWRKKKPSPHNDPSILSIQDAMLHFWL